MSQPSRSQIHIDKIMTEFSLRYMNMQDVFIADRLAPARSMADPSGYYYSYEKGYWFRDEALPRAPGSHFPEGGWEMTTASYNTVQYALGKMIADEDAAAADNPIDIDQEAGEWLATKMLIKREVQAAAAFFPSSGAWTSADASATNWENSSGVPITAVQRAQRTIQTLTGVVANTLACGLIVDHALQTNQQITDKVKYSQRALPMDIAGIMSAALGISNYLVSKAAYTTTNEEVTDAPTMTAVIDDDALVCYIAPPRVRGATAAFTAVWEPGGGLGQIERVRVDERKADMARIYGQWVQKLVSADLGYIFRDIVD